MRILLIRPVSKTFYENCRLSRLPPLNLAILAALSKGHHVRIADEDVEEIIFSSEWDLVGITVATNSAIEAYGIADRFRALGVKVVLGGVHATLVPEEASLHADAIVIGEAERSWPRILSDFPNLGKIYIETKPIELDKLPLPRRDLFHPSYISAPLQITRGCVHACEYCYLQHVPWKQYRKRPPESVVEEVAQIKNRFMFIIDDNFFVEKNYVMEIADKIRPFRKLWIAQVPLSLGMDNEMLKHLALSGLSGVALGIDSAIEESLRSVSKFQNYLKDAKTAVRNFHNYGITVSAIFIFGFEGEKKDVFARTMEMIRQVRLDWATFVMLTPFPGTKLFHQLEKEGRIITKDWRNYNLSRVVFKPSGMSIEEIEEGTKNLTKAMRRHVITHAYRYFPLALRLCRRSPRLARYMLDYLFMKPAKSEINYSTKHRCLKK